MVPFKSCFTHYPQIPNFYLAKPEMHPFLGFRLVCRASGLPHIKKFNKTKCSQNLILGGVPSIKNTPILTFDFHPLRTSGYPRALWVHRIKKLHKTKSDWRPIVEGVPYMENIEIPKFWSPLAIPAFQPHFLGPWAKNQNSTPIKLFASLSRIQIGVTRPSCSKTPGGDRFGRNPLFRSPGLTTRAPGSESPFHKLLARS